MPDMPEALRLHLIGGVSLGAGLEYEDKGYSVALHYRKAPKQAEPLRRHIAAARAAFPGVATESLKIPTCQDMAAVEKTPYNANVSDFSGTLL